MKQTTRNNIATNTKWGAGHWAWLAMFCGILIWNIGGNTSAHLGNTGNWYRIALVLFSAFFGLLAFLRNSRSCWNSTALNLMLLYGGAAFISSMLVQQNAFYSMFKSAEVIIVVVIAASFINSGRKSSDPYNLVYLAFCVLMVTFLVEALFIPSKAFIKTSGLLPVIMQGVYPIYSANGLGFLGAVVLFISAIRFISTNKNSTRLLYGLLSIIAIFTTLFAQSRTSIIALGLAGGIYLVMRKQYGLIILMTPIILGTVIFSGFDEVFMSYFMRGQIEENFTSLSGRTHGWTLAWEAFKASPVFGHGFAAAARTQILGVGGASTLHGAIFDVAVGVGMVGIITWGGALVFSGIRLIRLKHSALDCYKLANNKALYAELFGVSSMIFVRALTSSGLAMHDHTMMLALSIIVIIYSPCAKAVTDDNCEYKEQKSKNINTRILRVRQR